MKVDVAADPMQLGGLRRVVGRRWRALAPGAERDEVERLGRAVRACLDGAPLEDDRVAVRELARVLFAPDELGRFCDVHPNELLRVTDEARCWRCDAVVPPRAPRARRRA